MNPHTLTSIGNRLDEAVASIEAIRRSVKLGVAFAAFIAACTVTFGVITPRVLGQLNDLMAWRTVQVRVTCDTSVYDAEELMRRTRSQQRRIDLACGRLHITR